MNNFYIYIYLDPRKSGQYCYNDICFLFEPMYVGKGKNKRYLTGCGRNEDFIDIINEIKSSELEPVVIKLFKNLNEKQSLEIERKLILKIGRIDLGTGFLINRTSGGQGTSGRIVSEKSKKKMSESMIGKYHSEETKKKISESKKGTHPSEETRNKLSEKNKGNKNMLGKHLSEKTREKLSEKRKGENNPKHKLTEEQVIQIKLLLREGILTQQKIADMFGVNKKTISAIKNGRIWSYIKLGETT